MASKPGQIAGKSDDEVVEELVSRLRYGGWYFAVAVVSFGSLAAIPFWHAATKLRTKAARELAVVYTIADVVLALLSALVPDDEQSAGHEVLSTVRMFVALGIAVTACVQLRGVRRQVYSDRLEAAKDPAVARALAARARRDDARQLAAKDAVLARELGIGRPDLGGQYDDGGLVDLNSAPAEVIAQVCAIDRVHAQTIVAARSRRGGSFFSLGELFVDVALPPHVQDQVRDRAIVI